MDLSELFAADSIWQSLRLWTFASGGPRFLEFLKLRGGGFLVPDTNRVALTAPDCFEEAAVRLKLDIGALRIADGVTPRTVCVRPGSRQWGSPEFDWVVYREAHV